MRKIHISSLDAWIIQRQLKQFREIKIWNILLRGHNFPVYCSMSGEGWRVLLLQTKERFYLLQPAWLSLIQSAYLYVETLQIFTANFLAKEWRLCTKALFYAISSRYRVQETHLRRLHWIVTIRAISNFWGKNNLDISSSVTCWLESFRAECIQGELFQNCLRLAVRQHCNRGSI